MVRLIHNIGRLFGNLRRIGLHFGNRIVAIEQGNHSYAAITRISDLGKHFVTELEEFFVNYHELTGKQYQILDVRGPREAFRRIDDGRKAFRKK